MKKYTSLETARKLGVSTRTLERYRSSGKFVPAFKTVGGHSRYTEDQINEAKSGGKAEPKGCSSINNKHESCTYSKSMDQEYPRKCTYCGLPEKVEENINVDDLM